MIHREYIQKTAVIFLPRPHSNISETAMITGKKICTGEIM